VVMTERGGGAVMSNVNGCCCLVKGRG
jgi:hypothetical protein